MIRNSKWRCWRAGPSRWDRRRRNSPGTSRPRSSAGARSYTRLAPVSIEPARFGSRKRHLCQKLLQSDRQLAHADAGGVIDRIRNRRRSAHIGKLAYAFDAGWIDDVVVLRD